MVGVSSNLRAGLIGYGAWGSHHARAITATEGIDLVAITSRSEESRRQALQDFPGVATYSDFREMLDREKLDTVNIVLPSDLHFEVASKVLAAGCHLLLEKPMALSVADCKTLNELAAKRNLKLAVGHELRVSSLWGKVKEIIDAGTIGEPMHALIELWRRPYRLGSQGWRYDLDRVGSWILEEPIHFFDLARWYFAKYATPTSIYAAASSTQTELPGLHDNFSATVHFTGGKYAVITQTLAGWEHHQTAKLTGTKGAIWARWSGALDRTFDPSFKLQVRVGSDISEIPIAQKSGEVYELVDQIGAFVRAVRQNEPVVCSGDDGLWSVTLCLAAEQSLKTAQPVQLTEGAV